MFGVGNGVARLGGILAPLVNSLAEKSFMYVFGALGIACALFSFLLKETKGVVMADTPDQETHGTEGRDKQN